MIGQRAAGLPPQVQEFGCYLMSLVQMAWEFGEPHQYVDLSLINDLYNWAVATNAMTANCYIREPQEIVEQVTPDALFFLGLRPADYELADDERAIEKWTLRRGIRKQWVHFVYGSYDPWPRSATRQLGKLDSYRVFRVL